MKHHIGFIGLGKMGQNMVLNLIEQGIDVSIYNRTSNVTDEFIQEINTARNGSSQIHAEGLIGLLTPTKTLQALVDSLQSPKIILLMVKAGHPVDDVISLLREQGVKKGDILIDGGNSFFEDSVRRHDELAKHGIEYIDCGTSGGLEGARFGACLMIGGDKERVNELSWLWDILSGKQQSEGCECGGHEGAGCGCGNHEGEGCCDDGESLGDWKYFGPSGSGHFVKMVHNGVEYGMNQAIGEGFHLLAEGPYKLNLHDVADNWSRGSVVRGWLVELLERALLTDPNLTHYKGVVGGGETGNWTTSTAKKYKVPQPMLEQAISARKKSADKPTFATKVVSALRFEYGGHKE